MIVGDEALNSSLGFSEVLSAQINGKHIKKLIIESTKKCAVFANQEDLLNRRDIRSNPHRI